MQVNLVNVPQLVLLWETMSDCYVESVFSYEMQNLKEVRGGITEIRITVHIDYHDVVS